ncbi:glycosyltransferase [Noviherbaspirillum sedimenti]|uniref:Glycosyltransferase family 1 protein n=1 Tax=Noviherbaspirillum sedimenti TaxID=2320865 RepID=A0A3A3GJF0_9BURK|nr:glycosyltransferase [Noviherbaspirillum sedimenti]RJG01080.1 glycosyltransferase family 1 protein [Noviherbaspirillum sedimenti]
MKDECIVITWLARDQPGFLDFAYRVRALAKAYRTTLVSPYPLTQPELAYAGVESCVLPYGDGRAGWIGYMLACARLVRARKPACAVLLHSILTPLVLLTGKTPTALYWNEHPSRFTASPPGHPWWKRVARHLALQVFFLQAAKMADLVMPIGEAHHEELLRLGCRPGRVRLLYMGVDASFVRRRDEQASRRTDAPLELVYNGTVNHLRGRDVMLEAIVLANLERPIARLTIVGACEEQIAYCTGYAIRFGIADAVRVGGRIPGREIPGILENADAGLCFMEDLPWWRFNPPTKLFEYLVAGVPVLASDIRTHTQYVTNWYNGMICQYDSRSLADAIGLLWQRRADLPYLKRNARRSGEQYLWDRIEPEFLQAIKTIARSSGPLSAQPSQAIKKAAAVDKLSKEAR